MDLMIGRNWKLKKIEDEKKKKKRNN